jgi:hypothetical protein
MGLALVQAAREGGRRASVIYGPELHVPALAPEASAFYLRALTLLEGARVPVLLGGAYALAEYTGVVRHTKDLDVFIHQRDIERALAALELGGFTPERPFPHWLAKARSGEHFVDLIYGSGNGVAVVDDAWFAHAREGQVLERPIRLIPPEEMIWSKSWVQERERYDGADIMHLLRATGRWLDWERLVERFGARWRVLLSFLVLYGFVYPGDRENVPPAVVRRLVERLETELGRPADTTELALCQGTLLSREQYLIDVARWGHEDARLRPDVGMDPEHLRIWTEAIHAADEVNGTGGAP